MIRKRVTKSTARQVWVQIKMLFTAGTFNETTKNEELFNKLQLGVVT